MLGVTQQARTYAALAETARRVEEADSLLALGDLSDEAFAARIEAIEAERLRVYEQEQRRMEAERALQAFSGEGARFEDDPANGAPTPNASLRGGAGGVEGGFLNYRNPASIQAGLIAFEQRWGSRPLVPNWRRRSAISATNLASGIGGVGGEREGRTVTLGGGLPRLDISRVPRTPAKREELNTELAQLRYELANAFFLSLGRADTAAVLYRRILDETPDLPAAVRARYALAEIERGAGRDDAARPLYEEVVSADSEGALARASRARLGLDDDRPARPASGAETSAAYDAIRARWRAGAPREAAAAFVALGDADPDSAAAARSYLAAAAAYVEWAADSLTLTGPLPSDLVSSVLVRVPRTPAPAADRPALGDEEGEGSGGVAPAPAPVLRPQRRAVDSLNVPAYVADPEGEDSDDEDSDNEDVEDEDLDDSAAEEPEVDESAAGPLPPPDQGPSEGAESDSLVAEGGAAPSRPDSAAFTLRDHLAAIAELYPGTVYARRAAALQSALPAPPAGDPFAALRPGAAATDSTGRDGPDDPFAALRPDPEARAVGAPLDSLAAPPADPPAPDALEGGAAVDAGEQAGDVPPGEEEERLLPELQGTEPVDPAEGGATFRVRTLSIPTEGAALERGLRRAGYRVAVVTDGSAFYVVVGQFETADDAEAAREALPAWAQTRSEVVSLSDFSVVPRSEGGAGDFGP